ncbi:MAG: hypothetical protein M3R38_25695 [Actinomycetota bacterium]|nr:hypothetical protein [Actinomycetota bacterium]
MNGRPLRARLASWLAVSLWASCVSLVGLGTFFAYLSGFSTGFSQYLPNLIAGTLCFSTVGALVAYKRPGNPIGWLLCATGLLEALTAFVGEYGAYALVAGSLPGGVLALWFGSWTWLAAGSVVLFAFLLFPDGRLPSPRWRAVAGLYVLVNCLSLAQFALAPGTLPETGVLGVPPVANPFGVEAVAGLSSGPVGVLSLPLAVFTGLTPFAALFVRYRRAEREEGRQQIKWVAYAVALLTGAITAVSIWPPLDGTIAGLVLFMVGFSLSIPAAIGIAILRHRLYDIDVLINRTLVYAVLTAALALLYSGGVVTLQLVLRPLTGGESQLAIVASTLAIAALFSPLRRRIQGFIDRRFYRKKYDAAQTLESFSAKLREETDLDELNGDLLSVVKETMQPAHASLWLREFDREVRP